MKKVNKGGRPRKHGSVKSGAEHWKPITEPRSKHHYEISSKGQVRRKLKNGEYYNLKAWVTGGPYAAVYLTGIAGATRNRKKVYVHRLVANHFNKASKKPGNVVHHTVGPHSNTKSTLKWVTPSENNNARRFFTDDGKRKSKLARKMPKVEKNVPTSSPKPKILKEKEEKKVSPKPEPKKEIKEKLPDDPDEYYAVEGVPKIINWLIAKWRPFKLAWRKFRKENPKVNRKNFEEMFREATGKKFKVGKTPASWETRLTSAMYEISRRLELTE